MVSLDVPLVYEESDPGSCVLWHSILRSLCEWSEGIRILEVSRLSSRNIRAGKKWSKM